jgi:hypothetical protein
MTWHRDGARQGCEVDESCRREQLPELNMTEISIWIRFVLAVLATWRVTHLLASEDGPADLVVRFRALLGQGIAGKLMDCFNCLSLWIAAPAAWFVTRRPLEWLFCWLALSGGACLLERTREPAVVQSISQPAEGDINDVLRSETSGTAEKPGDNPNRDSIPTWH